MDIQTIEQIILMLGNATDSAVTIAILWIIGGYLMTITGWGVFVYIIKLIVERVYSIYTVDVKKEDYKILIDDLAKKNQEIDLLWEKHHNKQETLRSEQRIKNAEHKMELEKIKHLYKILKESKENQDV